jgi:hypothetical protein
MASIEYSYVQTLTAPGVGDSGYLYFPIGGGTPVSAGTISILKYLTIISTQSIGGGVPLFNYVLASSTTNAGPAIPIRCAPSSLVAANTAIPIVNDGFQYVVNNPYLALRINAAAAGNFIVYYSVLQFPNGNILNNNFSVVAGTSVSGNNSVVAQSTGFTPIVQSSNVMNLTSGALAFTYTYANTPITTSDSLAAFTDSPFNASIYIQNTGSNSFGLNGNAGLNYYFSVTTNMQP